ncbi:MAG: hypothetical protein M1822_002410 [Bathelium mastoideum]|nr:MAG: hypothetical protein M1822_002410 [Bathelium mastoideum]
MKEAHVDADTNVTIHDVPIPEITNPHQIIVRVVVSGCNPKDWKMPAGLLVSIGNCPNSGDDIAGIVHSVGSAVQSFRPGDRVAALHQLGAPYGSYAEYALVWDHTTFHIGDRSFEDAATIPMSNMMASIGLFAMLRLPLPWQREPTSTGRGEKEVPVLIYGAAGSVGAAAVKLCVAADIHPLICVAGSGISFVEGLIDKSKGDVVVDYRAGDEKLVENLKKALGGRKLEVAFDCVSEKGSSENACKVLEPGGRISIVLPFYIDKVPDGFEKNSTMAGGLWEGFRDDGAHGRMVFPSSDVFGFIHSSLVGKWFREGLIKPHPPTVVPGGLQGVETALKTLREGKAHAQKFVVRINETPGLK